MKVIYVSYMRLSDKASRDWYIDDLIAKGVTVEYWDIVPLLFGGDAASSKRADYLRTPRTYREIQAMLQLPENNYAQYIMLVSYEGRTAELYRILSKYDCRMYFIAWGNLPINLDSRWQIAYFRLISNPARFAQGFYYKIKAIAYRKLNLVKPYDVIFVAGQALLANSHYAKKVVPINMVDYDHYVRIRSEQGRITEGPFAVFLDINLPYQTDLKIVGLAAIDPKKYYESLNRFFDLVEEKYQIKVVIAAHPKANYESRTFHDRETYRGLTPELVRDADFVIAHHSASIGYAVLNKKPAVFIYTDEMEAVYKHTVISHIKNMAKYLDGAIYNINKISRGDQILIKEINTSCYDNFKYDFLTTHESENSSTREIFWLQLSAADK
jgi:hypothetical protein